MKLSIIIPVYNSSSIISILVDNIKEEIAKIQNISSYQIILVNDCSDDNSWSEIFKICNNEQFVIGINLMKNYGQHNAIMAGLNFVNGEIIILMDDDLQHDPIYILNLISEIRNGYDICYTNYINRKHDLYKIMLSEISNFLSSIIINKPFSLYLSSFKCINSKIKNKLIKVKDPNIYIDGYMLNFTRNITSINIEHKERHSGKSTYNLKKLIKLWINLILGRSIKSLSFSSITLFLIKIILLPIIIKRFFYKKLYLQFQINKKTF